MTELSILLLALLRKYFQKMSRSCTNIHVLCQSGSAVPLLWHPQHPWCVCDLYMDIAFNDKIMKWQPSLAKLSDLGYQCKLVVLIFGSLGHVHNLVFGGLRLAGLSSRKTKQLPKFCSISADIGSLAVWRRRCFSYPWIPLSDKALSYLYFKSCLL